MPRENLHEQFTRNYVFFMIIWDLFALLTDLEAMCRRFELDIRILNEIRTTRYLHGRTHVLKLGNIDLAWEYAQDTRDHARFVDMLRVSPQVFDVILYFIHDHPVFQNNSNNPQAPVQTQLAVTLYRMGRYGNGASVKDIAHIAGISEGSVENYTDHCLVAIESLHDIFVRKLTPEEKEVEKQWMDEHLGFVGSWRDGWVMYDGTIVVLYSKPGLHGDAYYTRKANYGLNVQVSTVCVLIVHLSLIVCMQIGNVPSNLHIVDYLHGMTGSAHDSAAFAHTGAAKHPDWFFDGDEFAWADSAYAVNSRTIPIHKQPASFIYENALFNGVVSHLRVRSEHCIGVLKGRFQCLRGL